MVRVMLHSQLMSNNHKPVGPPLPQGGAPAKKAAKRPVPTGATAGSSSLASLIKALLPILIVLAAVYYVQLQNKVAA